MSSADRENEQASKLIERLLVDPDFRAEFRRDPAGASVAAGMPELAAELEGSGRAMDTLMIRESKSSLAGVVMAVAVEGMSIAEAQALIQHGPPGAPHGNLLHGGALRNPLGHLRHAASPALPRELHGLRAGSPEHALRAAEHAAAGGQPGAASQSAGAGQPAGAGQSAAAPAPPASPDPAAAPQSAVAAPRPVAAPQPVAAAQPMPTPDPTVPPAAGTPAPLPADPGAQPADGGVVPQWPDQPSAGGGAAGGGAAGGGVAGGLGGAIGSGAVGAAGPSGGLMALLESPRLSASPTVRTFLSSGGADPRMVSVLDSALANHTIGLGQIESVSDPVHVQAVDIVSVDGQPVGPNNFAARDLVTEIAALDPSARPDEIGTPWPIHSQGFFSDAGSANRLHLAFEMPGTDTPPQVVVGQAPAMSLDPTASPGTPLTSIVPAPVAAATPGSGVDAALAYARAMIGKLPESAGSNLGPQLDKFEADFGYHGSPWCGIFAGHVLEAAGLKPPHSVAAVASILDLARNGDPPFVKGILPVSEARPGDLVTFGGTEHVAVVIKVDAAGVHTIAGNTSQSNVSETTYSPSSVTGVVRPDYAAGTPGSIPGVWDYAGVQPPGAAAGVGAPPVAPVAEAPAGATAPDPASQAVAPQAVSPQPVTPEPVPPQPVAPGAVAPQPVAPQPGPVAFNGHGSHMPSRNTVQFLPAVQPSPGSPLFGQAPRPVEVVQSVVEQQPSAAAAPEPVSGVAAQPQPVAGGLLDQASAAAAPTGGSISVSSSLLTPGQAKFAGRLAELTGLDPHVVAAWELAEESGSAAQGREAASNFNWLNIGYFDSGAGKIAFDKTFGDPISAAEQTAKFLKGEWGGASSSIRAILSTVGHSPDEQMSAIANSDWASSHYGGGANLHGTYNELGDIHIEKSPVA